MARGLEEKEVDLLTKLVGVLEESPLEAETKVGLLGLALEHLSRSARSDPFSLLLSFISSGNFLRGEAAEESLTQLLRSLVPYAPHAVAGPALVAALELVVVCNDLDVGHIKELVCEGLDRAARTSKHDLPTVRPGPSIPLELDLEDLADWDKD